MTDVTGLTKGNALGDVLGDVLREQRLFTPWDSGRYSVAAGLTRLAEGDPVFLFDTYSARYLETKKQQYQSHHSAFVQYHNCPPALAMAAADRLAGYVPHPHPLGCSLPSTELAPHSRLESTSLILPDDIAIISRPTPDSEDYLSALLVYFPNGWSAREKIGKTFHQTHTPVPGFEPVNARARQFVSTMIQSQAPLQRFVWGIRFDTHLDHRPPHEPPVTRTETFNPALPRAFVRVERQLILGLPAHQSALFLIRTFLYDVTTLPKSTLPPLIQALQTLSPEAADYKGLSSALPDLLPWLGSLA